MKPSIALCSLFLIASQPALSQSTHSTVVAPETTQNFDSQTLYQLLIGELALHRQDLSTALAAYTAAAQATKNPQIAAKATDIAIFMGRLKTALNTAEIWANQAPTDMEAQTLTALLFISQHQNARSLPYLARLQAGENKAALACFQVLYDQLSDPKDQTFFTDALAKLNASYPQKLGAGLALSNIYLSNNNPEAALALTTEALTRKTPDETLYILHSEALHLLNRDAESFQFMEKTIATYPQMIDLRLYQVEVLRTKDHTIKEARLRLQSLEDLPELPVPNLIQGAQISFEAGWIPETEFFLHKLQQYPGYEAMAAYFFGRIAEIQKKPNEAIDWYSQIEHGPFYVIARIHAVNLLRAAGDYTQALQWISTTYPETRADLKIITLIEVDLLSKMHRFSEALTAVDLAIADAPNDLDLRYIRSLLYEQIGDFAHAETDLRYVLTNKPQHVDALNALGYLLTTYSDRHQEALTYLEQAYAIAPNNAGILDSLGWTYYHLGDHDKAIAYLKTAHQLEPDSLIAAHFGEVLWESGDKARAREVWTSAQDTPPLHPHFIHTIKKYIPEALIAERE